MIRICSVSENERKDLNLSTGSPCNSQILGEMKIREFQNSEFQGTKYLGIDVP